MFVVHKILDPDYLEDLFIDVTPATMINAKLVQMVSKVRFHRCSPLIQPVSSRLHLFNRVTLDFLVVTRMVSTNQKRFLILNNQKAQNYF